jgi:hypothetical protein
MDQVITHHRRLDVGVIDAAKPSASRVFQRDGTTVTAQGIPHGKMPTLAYRVQNENVSVVFSPIRTALIRNSSSSRRERTF